MSEIFLTGSKKTNRQKKQTTTTNNNNNNNNKKQDKKQLQQELYSTKFKEMYPKFTRSSHVEIHVLIENKIKKLWVNLTQDISRHQHLGQRLRSYKVKDCTQHVVSWRYSYMPKTYAYFKEQIRSCQTQIHGEYWGQRTRSYRRHECTHVHIVPW